MKAILTLLLPIAFTACGRTSNPAEPSPAPTGTGGAQSLQHDPRNPAHLSGAGGRLSVRLLATRHEVQGATIHVDGRAVPMHRQLHYTSHEMWRGTLDDGATAYSLSVRTSSGTQELGPFTVPATLFRALPWVSAAVGYQIFPERFHNGDPGNDSIALRTDEWHFMHPAVRGAPPTLTPRWDGPAGDQHCCHQYFGGDLQGITAKLDHLQSLGVTLLYLNPIFLAGSAHGYDTWDYLTVDPALGDERVLRSLLDAAHARGIRVMWDFVPNHVGVGHVGFQDAIARGTASPYWSWFSFKVPAGQVQSGNANHYEAWWNFGSLPKLDTRNPATAAHLMEVVRHWTQFGFDGIRVDVPGEIANSADFFRSLRQVVKGIDPDVYLVGEIWERGAAWLQGDQFDALMNYAIGQDVIEKFVIDSLTASGALQAMGQLYGEYPEAATAMQFNLVSSHDNARLLTKVGGGPLGGTPGADALRRHRLASAMLLSLPGVPVTFQGDECAFLGTGGGREENRYPLQWHACSGEMVAHYRLLSRLKREIPALASPAIRFHHGERRLLSWYRGEPGSGELLALFNAGTSEGRIPLPAGSWSDVVSREVVSGTVAIGAIGWRFLTR